VTLIVNHGRSHFNLAKVERKLDWGTKTFLNLL
jgi:hypothetical protein